MIVAPGHYLWGFLDTLDMVAHTSLPLLVLLLTVFILHKTRRFTAYLGVFGAVVVCAATMTHFLFEEMLWINYGYKHPAPEIQ